jgi:hypothetical protein
VVELIAILLMIGAGIAIALFVVVAMTLAQHEREHAGGRAPASSPRDLEGLATSILFQLLLLGGIGADVARREVRQRAGLMAPVMPGVDVASWGERFAQFSTPQQRQWLLEKAVQCVAARTTPVPLQQYSALLDLSFALGFHTDALAKLREQYHFDYVDHARNGRPREADRAGGGAPLFVRDGRDRAELLHVLGIEDEGATRQTIISAYRRLAAQHHPDKVYQHPDDVKTAAAARFIEITRAYETLLAIYTE